MKRWRITKVVHSNFKTKDFRKIPRQLIEKTLEFTNTNKEFHRKILYALFDRINDGHIYLPLEEDFLSAQFQIDPPENFRKILYESGICGTPEENTPLILKGQKLYFHKHYHYEKQIAEFIADKLIKKPTENFETVKDFLAPLFSDKVQNSIQKAVRNVLNYPFSLITGGPGTGKTGTLLRSLIAIAAFRRKKTIVFILAPTGKAMDRVRIVIRNDLEKFEENYRSLVNEHLIFRYSTIHALLDSKSGHSSLPYMDYLFVDESSMIDCEMAALLLRRVSKKCSVTLIGDPNQLSSVNAGAIFPDLYAVTENKSQNKILSHNFRFGESPGLCRFSSAILSQNSEEFFGLQEDPQFPEIQFFDLDCAGSYKMLIQESGKQFLNLMNRDDETELFRAITQSIILCAFKVDAEKINLAIQEKIMGRSTKNISEIYCGLPILIEKNLYEYNLFNGEQGVILGNQQAGFTAAFLKEGGEVKKIAPTSLGNNYSIGYAITIHKSQGCEYEEVNLLLTKKHQSFLTRELIYTGATRAKKKLRIFSTRAVLESCLSKRQDRFSGLKEQIEQIQDSLL